MSFAPLIVLNMVPVDNLSVFTVCSLFMIAKILENSPDALDLGGKCWTHARCISGELWRFRYLRMCFSNWRAAAEE